MNNIEPYFYNHYDIVSLFREKEDVSDFLSFFIKSSIDISEKMKENNSVKPYPLILNQKSFSLSFDYQYYIYILAKWVVERTKNEANFNKVLNAFAILQSNSSSVNITKTKRDRKKFLSIFMTEFLGLLTNRNKFLDGTQKERKLYVQTYPSWVETLIECNGKVYALNQVMIDKMQAEYYLPGYKEILLSADEYITQNDVEQVAFGTKKCSSYLSNEQLKKEYYFAITDEYINSHRNLIEENLID